MSLLIRIAPFAIPFFACAMYLLIGEKPWTLDPADFTREVRESVRTHAHVIDGLYWAAAVNALLLAFGGVVFVLFTPKKFASTPLVESHVAPRERRILLGLIGAIMVFAGWQNAQRLGHSLWGDEESTTQKEILGMVWPEKEGDGYRIKAVSWQKTLWNWDRGPGNQVAYSAAARLVHGPAEPGDVTDPHAQHFAEWKLRLPAWFAGLGCLWAVAWVLWSLGFARAAPVACALIALHPWFIRWGSEARGYSFVMLLTPIAVGLLVHGVRSGRWRWWIGLGVVQFLLLWSHLGSLYFLVALNLGGAIYAWQARRNLGGVWQLGVSSFVGAVLTIQVMGPLARQLLTFLEKDPLAGEIGGAWMADWAAFWTTGMPLYEWDATNALSLTASPFALIPIALAFLAGLYFWGRAERSAERWLMLVVLLPAPLFIGHAVVGGSLIYPWYVVGFLPLFLAIAGVGAARHWTLSVVLVGVFFAISHSQRQAFIQHPIEPLRESVAATRAVTNPWHPEYGKDVLTLGAIHPTRLYDPGQIYTKSDAEVEASIHRAHSEGKSLLLNGANLGLAEVLFPQLHERLKASEPIEVLPGQFIPATTRFVYRIE